MTLKINTNIAAMNAHKNMVNTGNRLSSSLEKLSSGLRINKAADDASGMAIADSLKAQSLGIGQAIRNANDGISIVQTADGALEESINIVNTIKTKAIQSAQDGQTTESRKAIQADIDKLLQNLDSIAKNTAFNNQKLLSGNFINKAFQVGAYAGETVNISIASTESTKMGHINTTEMTVASEGTVRLDVYSNLLNRTISLQDMEVRYDNSRENSLANVADAINKLSDQLGISAKATVVSTTNGSIQVGKTDSDFAINGVHIGEVFTVNNDADGALVAAINAKTDQHGVVASVDAEGKMTLTSTDGRALHVTQGDRTSETTKALGNTTGMSTFGVINLSQTSTAQITINDRDGRMLSVTTEEGGIMVSGTAATTRVSHAAAGSYLASGTVLNSGTVVQGSFKVQGANAVGNSGATLGAGSRLLSGTIIGSGSTLTTAVQISGEQLNLPTGGTTSILAADSFLTQGTIIGSGTILKGDYTHVLSGAGGAVAVHYNDINGYTYISGDSAAFKQDFTLFSEVLLQSGVLNSGGTVLAAGSRIEGTSLTLTGETVLEKDLVINKNSTAGQVASSSTLTTGSSFASATMTGSGKVDSLMTLTIGTNLGNESWLANGSTIGGAGYGLTQNMTVAADSEMVIGKNSVIVSGSTIAAGTTLQMNVYEAGTGNTLLAGTKLNYDVIISGDATVTGGDMNLAAGSILLQDSTLHPSVVFSDATTTKTAEGRSYRLSDVDVTSQESAQLAIAIADAALKDLSKTRADLGSVQNQLTSTIANLSVTRVNISAAESGIRDVDFAEEAANFSKFQILNQAGSFAMAQANATSQNVLSLLQG